MGQLENELSDTQTKLETATKNLEEKEKALQNVSFVFDGISSVCSFCSNAWWCHPDSKSWSLNPQIIDCLKFLSSPHDF